MAAILEDHKGQAKEEMEDNGGGGTSRSRLLALDLWNDWIEEMHHSARRRID